MQIKHKTCFLKKMNAVYSHTPTSIDSNSYDFYHHRLSLAYLYISNCFLSSYHRKTCFIVKFGLTYIIYYYILWMIYEPLLTPLIVVRDNHLAAAVPEREGELSSSEGSLRGNTAYKMQTNILLSQNLLPFGRLH